MCGPSHKIWVLFPYVQMPKIKAHAEVSRGAKLWPSSTSILSIICLGEQQRLWQDCACADLPE